MFQNKNNEEEKWVFILIDRDEENALTLKFLCSRYC